MPLPRIVAFSGNVRRPSRTRVLIEAVAAELAEHVAIDLTIHDLLDAGRSFGTAYFRDELPTEALAIVEAIEKADALIVGSPVYKGSYAGLFKHLIDFVEPTALENVPVVVTATGGGPKHALVVEHQLRPLFGFFSAQTLPTAVYASDQDFLDGRVVNSAVLQRVESAARQLARHLDQIPDVAGAAPKQRLAAAAS